MRIYLNINNRPGLKNYLIVFFFIICLFPVNASALIGIKEGDAPKEINLNDLNGQPVDITGLFGKKPVIIIFWELVSDKSFLDYSMDELRFLNDYYEKYRDRQGLEIFGIYTPVEQGDITESELAEVRNLIKSNKINFPILIDNGFKVFRDYGVIALPSTIMVGRNGKIEFIYPSFPISAQAVFSEKIPELTGTQAARKKEDVKIKGPDSQASRLYHYALQMYKRGLLEQAVSPLKKSLSLDTENAWSHNLMGIVLWARGNFDGAVAEFNRALELDINNNAAHFNYGLMLFENDKYGDAEKHFKTALALNDNFAEAHYILGMLYKITNRHNDALKELQTSFALLEKKKSAPVFLESSAYQRISTLFALSELYAQSGDQKACLELLHKAAQTALGIDSKTDKEHLYRSKDLMVYE